MPIDLKTAEQLWTENQQLRVGKQQIATAITRADQYWSITRFSMMMIALTLWTGVYPLGSLVEGWVVCLLLVISYGAQWLSHNGTLVTNDADYLEAVVKVKKAMLAWAVLLLIQVAAYLIINGLPDWNTILD